MFGKEELIPILISFFLSGLGITYLGDIKKGIGIFAIFIFLNILGLLINGWFSDISVIVWIAGLYLTYKEVQAVNGY